MRSKMTNRKSTVGRLDSVCGSRYAMLTSDRYGRRRWVLFIFIPMIYIIFFRLLNGRRCVRVRRDDGAVKNVDAAFSPHIHASLFTIIASQPGAHSDEAGRERQADRRQQRRQAQRELRHYRGFELRDGIFYIVYIPTSDIHFYFAAKYIAIHVRCVHAHSEHTYGCR